MKFRVLGPTEFAGPDGPIQIGPLKQRALLGFLLIHANEVVATDRIIDALWGGQPPRGAPKTLQVYVSSLRKALEPDRAIGTEPTILLTAPCGYVLRVAPGDLDAAKFENSLNAAEARLPHQPASAAKTLREILGMWRGRPYEDIAYEDFAQAEIRRLEDLHLRALENLAEADLRLGHHRAVADGLESLVVKHPYRERLWSQLMVALYRSDRQVEALEAFQRASSALDAMGVAPSALLTTLEDRIVRRDPSLAWHAIDTAGNVWAVARGGIPCSRKYARS